MQYIIPNICKCIMTKLCKQPWGKNARRYDSFIEAIDVRPENEDVVTINICRNGEDSTWITLSIKDARKFADEIHRGITLSTLSPGDVDRRRL